MNEEKREDLLATGFFIVLGGTGLILVAMAVIAIICLITNGPEVFCPACFQ
jgi:hypothetical protein